MKPALLIEQFNGQPVRVYGTPEEPLFVAADVCRILEIQNPSQAIAKLDSDERAMFNIGHVQGETNLVTESGLYTLILRCRDAVTQGTTAHAFRKWVTSEVLPAIRKTGSYSQSPALPKTYAESLRLLAAEVEANERLALENSELRPKAEFFDAVAASDDSLAILEVAKLLRIGRNTLMSQMRTLGILRRNNTPYQQFIDAGYFKVVESKWTDNRDGSSHVTLSTRVFQRGVDYLSKRLKADEQKAA